jgi:hypothetical protein
MHARLILRDPSVGLILVKASVIRVTIPNGISHRLVYVVFHTSLSLLSLLRSLLGT